MINKTSSIRLRFFFCALFLFIHLYTRGQNSKIVQGKIIERTTGQAISYASIKLIKASQSTISNVEGIFVFSYSIPLPGDSLTISAVGYSTVKIAISDFISKNRTIIALEENVTILNTVAVTPLRAEVI
ncbi:MAG: hypothetical protein EOP00_25285 [Pedobacter sp.]|nr:MAG: hypothetical protein EOP00_25285 [Pedobacter sp.]